MLCACSSQYPHRPIPPDQSRSVEVNGTGSVVVPAPAVLQALVPAFWSVEILNTLLLGERKGRIAPEQTKAFSIRFEF
jgi:hypothetical protein